jgi:hypothetical protein
VAPGQIEEKQKTRYNREKELLPDSGVFVSPWRRMRPCYLMGSQMH